MKKRLLLILVVLTAFNSFAQQDSLQNLILGYHDPDLEIISKGRALLADKFQKGDLQKVKEIKDLLEAKAKGQDYMAFYPMEVPSCHTGQKSTIHCLQGTGVMIHWPPSRAK